MNTNELFTVAANGQLEVNFESLAARTSEEFVQAVKEALKPGYVVVKRVVDIFDMVDHLSVYIAMTLKDDLEEIISYEVLSFDSKYGKIHTNTVFLHDLRILNNLRK